MCQPRRQHTRRTATKPGSNPNRGIELWSNLLLIFNSSTLYSSFPMFSDCLNLNPYIPPFPCFQIPIKPAKPLWSCKRFTRPVSCSWWGFSCDCNIAVCPMLHFDDTRCPAVWLTLVCLLGFYFSSKVSRWVRSQEFVWSKKAGHVPTSASGLLHNMYCI